MTMSMDEVVCTYQIPRGHYAPTKTCGLVAPLVLRGELSRTLTIYTYRCPDGHQTRVEVKR